MARVTVVNDNPEFLELMGEVLQGERHAAVTIDADGDDLVDRIRDSDPDLLILDVRAAGSEEDRALEVARRVREVTGDDRLPILLCSADLLALDELRPAVASLDCMAVLAKPFGIDELTEAIDRLLAIRSGR